ncbi:MAG: SHOCT domain-containing protein [Anaerolineaceae bacterium]
MATSPVEHLRAVGGFETTVGVEDRDWWGRDGHMGAGGWVGMWFMMAIFWIAVILLAVWAIRSWGGQRSGLAGSSTHPSALDVARERYAKGEITDEEFERIKAGLQR